MQSIEKYFLNSKLCLIRMISGILIMLISGCTSIQYQYIPPTTDAGRQCVTTCDTNRQICIAGKEQVAETRNEACENRNSNSRIVCLATARTDAERQACTNKRESYCSNYSDSDSCDTSYRFCYTQCGGQVKQITVEQDVWQ